MDLQNRFPHRGQGVKESESGVRVRVGGIKGVGVGVGGIKGVGVGLYTIRLCSPGSQPFVLCNRRKEITPNHVFHAFPKDTARCMAWLNVIQVPQLFKESAQDLNRSYRLCSRHFSPKNYTNGTTSSRLFQNALPDQNLNFMY
ncbi:uncharacterized protein LOC143022614 isoform X2 [Oratosquilla oratoria]|uniref:uncharacterized protein LOC143022614 isoform X2 n=1 Tax=Oratosquilla oratoria TaxID=337810 RepID=UPI003F76E681